MAYYSMFYTCDGWEKGVTPLNDFDCMSHPKDIHYKIVLFTAGFLVYDFILYFWLVGAQGTLAKQTFVHHVLGASGFYITIYTGNVPTVYTSISLFVESSSVFANIRWFTFAFKVKSVIAPAINSALLFLSYFFFRIIFHTYITFKYSIPWVYQAMTQPQPAGYNVVIFRSAAFFIFVVNMLSQLINFWWFHLIMKQVVRNYKKATGQGGDYEDL